MNAHRLYSAVQSTERALHHLRNAWMQQDGVIPKTINRDQIKKEVTFSGMFLSAAQKAVEDALASETPEEVKPEV